LQNVNLHMFTTARAGRRVQAFICCSFFLAAMTKGEPADTNVEAHRTQSTIAKTNPITDLMLIYDAGNGKTLWTADAFKPYVYREQNGQFDWLFDGFLFIDFLAPSGARLCPITQNQNANQQDWQELIDHYLQDGTNIAALEQLMQNLEAKGHRPIRKRQVVITLPTPIAGSLPKQIAPSTPWGNPGGKAIDFHNPEDRVKAAQWYIDEVLKRWRAKHFKHLELAGFYWVFERAWTEHRTADISRYLHVNNCAMYWIPSWPQGRTNWKDYGFDFVYQQPNYFFHRKPTPSSQLEEACRFVEQCGTSMEMEFNNSLFEKPEFLKYFDEYLDVYRDHHVWERKPVAYYEGHGAFTKMAVTDNPAIRSRYQALTDLIIERQKKCDAGFTFSQSH
jgi:hypothetical protein